MAYDPKIKEEELKNKVAADLFPEFDCTRILGNVDFCVQPKVRGPTLWETESLLWAEAKAGVRPDFAPLFAQLVLTVGGEKTFERHSPPPFLGAYDAEKIAFLPWHVVLDLFFRSDVDWSATPSDTELPAFRHVLGLLRPVLGANLVLFRFGDPDLAKFAKKNLFAGNDRTNRLPVTRNNFPFVWRHYHAQPGALPDASFYDIRAHFQGFKPNGHMNPDSGDATYTALVGALRAAERALAAKLAPKVYEHGFLQGAPAASAGEACPDAELPPLFLAED